MKDPLEVIADLEAQGCTVETVVSLTDIRTTFFVRGKLSYFDVRNIVPGRYDIAVTTLPVGSA